VRRAAPPQPPQPHQLQGGDADQRGPTLQHVRLVGAQRAAGCPRAGAGAGARRRRLEQETTPAAVAAGGGAAERKMEEARRGGQQRKERRGGRSGGGCLHRGRETGRGVAERVRFRMMIIGR
jgi:hypothetical protein